MKKIFTLLLCLLYTFVTFGGSIFMHNCGENTILSIYEKPAHDTCPICSSEHGESKMCDPKGSCNDIEIKIDQLADKVSSSVKAEQSIGQPPIFVRFWIDLKPFSKIISTQVPYLVDESSFATISPPNYILNCNFRN